MRSRRRVEGAGVLLEELPVELHIPGYNYCGPGTKLQKRLARGDKGINLLDEACKERDIAYASNSDRHIADRILADKAKAIRRRKDLVKWLGFPSSVNSWIAIDALLYNKTHGPHVDQ